MVAVKLMSGQVPLTLDGNDSQTYTLGTTWYTTASGRSVTGIEWRVPDTLPTGTVTVGLFNYSTEALLASATATALVAGTYVITPLDSAVAVAANTPYIAAVFTPQRYTATNGFFTGAGDGQVGELVNDDLHAPADGDDPGFGTLRQARLDVSASLTYPGSTVANAFYHVGPAFAADVTGSGLGAVTVTATAAGLRTVLGASVAGAITASSTATGTPEVLGAASSVIAVQGVAAAMREVLGSASGAVTMTATATDTDDSPTGLAEGAITVGGHAYGVVTRPDNDSVPSGGWYGLLAIYREAAMLAEDDRNSPPQSCPNDGEPLQAGPGGVLHCRFDGYIWPEAAGRMRTTSPDGW